MYSPNSLLSGWVDNLSRSFGNLRLQLWPAQHMSVCVYLLCRGWRRLRCFTTDAARGRSSASTCGSALGATTAGRPAASNRARPSPPSASCETKTTFSPPTCWARSDTNTNTLVSYILPPSSLVFLKKGLKERGCPLSHILFFSWYTLSIRTHLPLSEKSAFHNVSEIASRFMHLLIVISVCALIDQVVGYPCDPTSQALWRPP